METNNASTTAVAVAQSMSALQVCQNAVNIEKLGELFAQSGFFGEVTKSKATAALINCFIEGLSPLEYRAKYHILTDGTTSVKSDFIQREFHRLGGSWRFNEWTPEVCDMTFTYGGQDLRGRVTLDEFIANGVAVGRDGKTLKTNWAKFPREMLKARCMATHIRALCPEALGGMYTQEEAADFNTPPTPAPQAAPAAKPQQAKAQTPTPPAQATVDAEIVEAVDYGICPVGRAKGKRFDAMPTETLESILATDPAKCPKLTDGHRETVKAILLDREVAQ